MAKGVMLPGNKIVNRKQPQINANFSTEEPRCGEKRRRPDRRLAKKSKGLSFA
jgi:hypothetical protein